MMREFFKIDFHENRIYGFDIIRTIALLSVLFGHGISIIPAEKNTIYLYAVEFLDGVFVFFILSGFLIGQLLIYTIENKSISIENLISFWKKRLLRTVPAYYFVLILLIILSLLSDFGFGNIKLLLYFIFSQNIFQKHPFFFGEAWTLSIEVWFYILIPLFVFATKKLLHFSDKNTMLFVSLFFISFGTLVRFLKMYAFEPIDATIIDLEFRKQVFTRIDSVTFGIIGAYIFRYYNKLWLKNNIIYLAFGILIFLYTKFPIFPESKFYRLVLFYPLQSISFLLVLPFFSQIKKGSGLFFNIITTLSYVSFSIYLINYNLVQVHFLNKIQFLNGTDYKILMLKYFLYLILSVFGGILMYKKIELPFMKMRKD
ncbi:acyltransferase family protein [Flavobacterium columnare]|uniref:acyltransferase family protein n=1 Tax=Flavobacterium columnare TaxID=996 RepID=UPI00403399C9